MSKRRPFDPESILQRLKPDAPLGRFDIRIDRDGAWYHEGGRIERKALCRLLASVLHRREDGSHWLVTPGEQGRIEVEDAAFTAVELRATGEGASQRLSFRTNLDDRVEAGADHPLTVREGVPYLLVRGRLEARLLRPVFYELADLAVPGEAGDLGVWSGGRFFPLGPAEGGPA
ncbi:MAG: DUF1285 domain-containing protein [Geminicoccaceae bacterium]|nr:DUF1285 domain-containing protein [Geminicoccaceae bacterium]